MPFSASMLHKQGADINHQSDVLFLSVRQIKCTKASVFLALIGALCQPQTADSCCSHFRTGPMALFLSSSIIFSAPLLHQTVSPICHLGASSASDFSWNCHWIALDSTGWYSSPVVTHEGHWLCRAVIPNIGCFILDSLFICSYLTQHIFASVWPN